MQFQIAEYINIFVTKSIRANTEWKKNIKLAACATTNVKNFHVRTKVLIMAAAIRAQFCHWIFLFSLISVCSHYSMQLNLLCLRSSSISSSGLNMLRLLLLRFSSFTFISFSLSLSCVRAAYAVCWLRTYKTWTWLMFVVWPYHHLFSSVLL